MDPQKLSFMVLVHFLHCGLLFIRYSLSFTIGGLPSTNTKEERRDRELYSYGMS